MTAPSRRLPGGPGVTLLSVLVSLCGVGVFMALSLPLPWLLGPLSACLIAALVGVPLRGLPAVSNLMRTVLGVAVGSSITPALVHRVPEMLGSLVLVLCLIGFAIVVGPPFFRRLWGFDPPTAYYASMPGGLQDMLVFGIEAGGNPRALSLVHATRVLIIVAGLPLLFVYVFDIQMSSRPGAPAADMALTELALMAFLAIAGWRLALRIHLFGASILGPLILTAAASLAGLVEHRPPAEAIVAAQFFIGLGVGVNYVGITGEEIRKVVLAGAGYTVLMFLAAMALGAVAIELDLAPVRDIILAYAPGGQGELALLAIVAHADLSFVVTHHVFRVIVVITGAPVLRRFFS